MQKEVVFKVVKDMGITLTREETEQIQRIPTKNLQAFLAYSIGLEKEGQGDFEAAGVYFKQARRSIPRSLPPKPRRTFPMRCMRRTVEGDRAGCGA